jgi:plasmid stabilization system protein ParE
MPRQIIWSPQAENDLSLILEYLQEHWDKSVLLKFIDIVDEIINQISINPKQYPIIRKQKRIRKCVITKHNSLYYRDRKGYIDILRIYDNRQDPRKLKFA